MSDAKLQKLILPPNVIDLSFGEPRIIANELLRTLPTLEMPTVNSLKSYEYQPAAGMPKLVELLEFKYKAKVVVTNGAKQGLAAVLHALKKKGFDTINYETPFYPATEGLVKDAKLYYTPSILNAEIALITSPNNPDGKFYDNTYIQALKQNHYVVHDAAYYTSTYLPDGAVTGNVGHVQIFSFSKMYGLSGLRIGYVVFHDDLLYKEVVDFIETSTAGVSTASQDIAYEVEVEFIDNKDLLTKFETNSNLAIKKNRELLTLLQPNIMAPTDCQSNSMFAWMKKGPKLNYKKSEVHMLDGSLFGDSSMVRMNLAVPNSILEEAIRRLNKI